MSDIPLIDKRKELLDRFAESPLYDIMPLILEQDAEAVRKLKEEFNCNLGIYEGKHIHEMINKVFGEFK